MGAYARVFALAGISPRRREISAPDSDQFALAAQAIVAIINLCRFLLYLLQRAARAVIVETSGRVNMRQKPLVSCNRGFESQDSGMMDIYRE